MAKYNVLNDEYKELELSFNGLALKKASRYSLYSEFVEDYFREEIDYEKIDHFKRKLKFKKANENDFKNEWGYILKNDKEIIEYFMSGEYDLKNKLSKNPIKILKDMASTRKNLAKDYDNFLKYRNLVSDLAYGNLLVKTFNYCAIFVDDYWNGYRISKYSEYRHDPLFKQISANIKDQEMKIMKTNFKYDWPDYYDDSWGPDPNMIDFTVVTDYPINENHRYTKKEIDKLLEDKKIIIVGFDSSYLDGKEYTKAEEYPKSPNIYDYWWAQPLAISYIRNDEKLNKQMTELIEKYKAETKEIMHDIFKAAVNIYEKQKEYLKKTVKEELEKEEIRHNKKTKEIKEQKTIFENDKKELDELLMEM